MKVTVGFKNGKELVLRDLNDRNIKEFLEGLTEKEFFISCYSVQGKIMQGQLIRMEDVSYIEAI